MAGKVALIFVFNHRYDKNIDVLDKMYEERFSNRYFLVPFYNGDRKNVIPVYENSFQFQGYLAQGLKHYFNETYEHYFFVADDLVLNPAINEHNYKTYFNLTEQSSFIPELFLLHEFTNNHTLRFNTYKSFFGRRQKLYWWRIKDVIKYRHKNEGVENEKEMPTRQQAQEQLAKHGYHVKPLTFADIYGWFPLPPYNKEKRQQALRFLYRLNRYNKEVTLDYPMVASYSDVLIVSSESIKKFCHYCGVFASNKLFVECAIPTALLLASDAVVTENDLDKRGQVWWGYTKKEAGEYEEEMQRYEYNLKDLLRHFPKEKLYIHPIKLSKWQTGIN